MASVYYLFDDAKDIADYIIWSTEAKFELDKRRYFAALIIQRTFRGYVVRCQYMTLVKSAIVIQKHVRGYLLRIHLHEIAAKAFREKSMANFHKLATTIQATWRGYWVRKNFNIETILAERKEEEETHAAIADFFNSIFALRDPYESSPSLTMGEMDEEELFAHKIAKKSPEILRGLFERHHLLRTRHIEGVLSLHGSEELSLLETFLKRMECKEYMDEVRRLYREDNNPNFEYMFGDKNARKVEDMLREKKHRDGVERFGSIEKESIHREPFVVVKKLQEEPYEKCMLGGEKYTGSLLPVFREERKVVDRDRFKLEVHHITKDSKREPPYFIDHWKKICCNHNFMYDFESS